MSGVCSQHKYHDPTYKICNAFIDNHAEECLDDLINTFINKEFNGIYKYDDEEYKIQFEVKEAKLILASYIIKISEFGEELINCHTPENIVSVANKIKEYLTKK